MKIKIILLIVIIFLAGCDNPAKDSFLNSLKGEVVYAKRDGLILNIYKINANGRNKQLLYRHTGENNLNCSNPRWSKDGSKVSFSAMKNGKWSLFLMDPDGSNVEVVQAGESLPLHLNSRQADIIVRYGSVYYLDEKGNEIEVYKFRDYNSKFNPGASEASWSPDKQFIIFNSFKGSFLSSGRSNILIVGKDGKMARITEGIQADWKY